MAKIVPSDAAPSEAVHYSFAGVEFDLGGSKKNSTFDTDDAAVLANAEAHPWLSVEYPAVEGVLGDYREQIAPEDDPFTAQGQKVDPNDPEAAVAAEEAKADVIANRVAIDAGVDQTEAVSTAGVSETLADANNSDTKDKN